MAVRLDQSKETLSRLAGYTMALLLQPARPQPWLLARGRGTAGWAPLIRAVRLAFAVGPARPDLGGFGRGAPLPPLWPVGRSRLWPIPWSNSMS